MSKTQAFFLAFHKWVTNFLEKELEIACITACQIQNIEKACVRYQHASYLTHDQFQILKLYLDTVREQSLEKVEQNLLKFERFVWLKAKNKKFCFQHKLWFIEKVVWEVNELAEIYQHRSQTNGFTADEPIGLIPRSIARTFSRLQTELDSQAKSLFIQEFKLIRYQAIASFQFISNLLFLPWLCQNALKIFFFEPIFSYWWNTGQTELFFNSFQEQKALEELQKLEDTAWLDFLMTYPSEVPLSLFLNTIHERALQLVVSHNNHSIQALVQVCTDSVFVCILVIVLVFSQRKLSLAQMRSVEVCGSYKRL